MHVLRLQTGDDPILTLEVSYGWDGDCWCIDRAKVICADYITGETVYPHEEKAKELLATVTQDQWDRMTRQVEKYEVDQYWGNRAESLDK